MRDGSQRRVPQAHKLSRTERRLNNRPKCRRTNRIQEPFPFGRASGIELLKSRWWIGERRRPGEKSPQGCLSGLFVTDSKSWFLLGGLYMALFPQYAEYELRNSNAYTRRFSAFGAIYRRSSVFELLKSAIDKRSSGFRRRQNRR